MSAGLIKDITSPYKCCLIYNLRPSSLKLQHDFYIKYTQSSLQSWISQIPLYTWQTEEEQGLGMGSGGTEKVSNRAGLEIGS